MTYTYEQWYAQADRECLAISGLSINDLADGPSYDAFEDGASPQEYALDLLGDEGFPS